MWERYDGDMTNIFRGNRDIKQNQEIALSSKNYERSESMNPTNIEQKQ